jgi:hypothetical protein
LGVHLCAGSAGLSEASKCLWIGASHNDRAAEYQHLVFPSRQCELY